MKINNALYFDHQASTPLDPRVLSKMEPYLNNFIGNPHSADHAFGWRTLQAIENASVQISKLIGSDSSEIFFTSGATESNNLALIGLAKANKNKNKNRIIISTIEHKCVLNIVQFLKDQYGYIIDSIPVDNEGKIHSDNLENIIDDDVFAVSIIAVNNEVGTIQDIKAISELTTKAGAILHCDGAQAPCAMDLTAISNKVDLLSLSSHKMYGPQGVGILYIRKELQDFIEPIIYGGGQQNNVRSGTLPVALCVGMGEAAFILDKDEAKAERLNLAAKRDLFIDNVLNLSWSIKLNGPVSRNNRHPGNSNICFEGFSSHDILGALQPSLAASTGSACTTGIPEPSHVLKAIGLSTRDANSSIRFSIGRYTTEDDIMEAVKIIDVTLNNLYESDLMEIG